MEMVVGAPRSTHVDGRLTVSSRVRLPGEEAELWFRGPEDALVAAGADAFLIVCLASAMKRGLPLVLEAEVSPRLLRATGTLQDIYRCWYPRLQKVPIHATAVARDDLLGHRGTASFFSGGVDSFYTALRHAGDVSMLVLVHGFDMALDNQDLRSRASASLARAAGLLGKRLVEIETNSRELTDRHASWTFHQFGPALASVAALLGGAVSRVLIPASESYAHLDPCGSHPLTDPLWSTEYMEVVHDGAEVSRNEKVALLAGHPELLPLLRVCWENRANRYNCGICEKCIRTMIHLEAAGVLQLCPAFEAPLVPATVARMAIPNDLVFHHVVENLHHLRVQGRNPALVRALDKAVRRYRAEQVASRVLAVPPGDWLAVLRALSLGLFSRKRRRP